MTTPNNDKKLTSFMWIVGIIVSVFCGAGLTVAVSYGGTKQQVDENCADIITLQKRSVDYIYITDLIQSNYMLIDILKATPESKEMEEALRAWREFQMNTMKRANPSRGGKAEPTSAADKAIYEQEAVKLLSKNGTHPK